MATRIARPTQAPAKPAQATAKPAAKPVAKTATKAAAKPAAPTPPVKPVKPAKAAPTAAAKPVKAVKPAKTEKIEKADKPKKPKLVRDSFTIPKTEYAAIDALKQRAAKAGAPVKKSELLRAGLKALATLNDAAFLAAVQAVPTLKTGRPAKA